MAKSNWAILTAGLILAGVTRAGSESVTLSTYYPAPSGTYTQLISVGKAVLARDFGSVGIGITNPGALLHVKSAGGGVLLRLQGLGGTCDHTPAAAAETVTCSSDRRLKMDIQDAPDVLKDIAKLRIRRYRIRSTGEKAVGVIAQEVEGVAPGLVKKDRDGTLMVSQIGHWELIKAIQELQAENAALKRRLDQMELQKK